MTLKQYLILMSLGTLICYLAWFYIIQSVDPYGAGALEMIFFYLSLFLALVGTFSVIGFLAKQTIFKRDEIVFHHVKRTFRHGFLLAFVIIVMLFMRQIKVLTWWNALALLILVLVLESLFFSVRKFHNRDTA